MRPVPRSDGTTDFYTASDRFHDVFCQDIPAEQAALPAATQPRHGRGARRAVGRPAVEGRAAVLPDRRGGPHALQRSLADRAGSQRTVAIDGASHAITVSRPDATRGDQGDAGLVSIAP